MCRVPLKSTTDAIQSPQDLEIALSDPMNCDIRAPARPPPKHKKGDSLPSDKGGVDTILKDGDALRPDPGTEDLFHVENNKFAFSPGQLSKLINPKSLYAFRALGGLSGLEKGLRSDRASGLSVDETVLDG